MWINFLLPGWGQEGEIPLFWRKRLRSYLSGKVHRHINSNSNYYSHYLRAGEQQSIPGGPIRGAQPGKQGSRPVWAHCLVHTHYTPWRNYPWRNSTVSLLAHLVNYVINRLFLCIMKFQSGVRKTHKLFCIRKYTSWTTHRFQAKFRSSSAKLLRYVLALTAPATGRAEPHLAVPNPAPRDAPRKPANTNAR